MSANDFTYFPDPQSDRLASLVWQLAGELHVTRQRLAALEKALAAAGVVTPEMLEATRPDPAVRDALLNQLMPVLTEHGPAAHPSR